MNKYFLSDLPPRILSQKIGNEFFAWFFDGINQIGEKISGETREKAIQNLLKNKQKSAENFIE